MPGYALLRRPRQRAFQRVLRSVFSAVPPSRRSIVFCADRTIGEQSKPETDY